MLFFKYFSKLPFFVLYGISDFANFIIYHVLGYRKKIVYENIRNSFPERSESEIKQLIKDFYHHFTDTFIEFIKGYTISKEELNKRIKITNVELVNTYTNKNHSIIIVTGHNGNWEWLLHALNLTGIPIDVVYQKLSNKLINRLTLFIRSRFAITPLIEKNDIMRKTLERKDVTRAIALASDQSPQHGKVAYWTTFLHQDSAFFTGSEKIARKFNYPVFFCDIKKVNRGFYEVSFVEIANPNEYPNLPMGEITERFVRILDKAINKYPADYLWSHRRWKHKRNKNELINNSFKNLKS